MLKGSIPASIGAFGFMITIAKTTGKLGMCKSFVFACGVCLIIIFFGVLFL
jgi:hypothetical protein